MTPFEDVIAALRRVPRQLLPLVPISACLGAAIFLSALAHVAVGNAIEKSRDGDRYRIIVRMDDGKLLVLEQMGEGALRPGDRVRGVNNRVYRA